VASKLASSLVITGNTALALCVYNTSSQGVDVEGQENVPVYWTRFSCIVNDTRPVILKRCSELFGRNLKTVEQQQQRRQISRA